MADRFYANCPLAVGPVTLAGAEAHHIATVLRARPGDAVCLFNGDGAEYQAVITDAHKKSVTFDILSRRTPLRELGFRLEVAAAVPKSDRGDFLVEKLTELGATRFIPLETQWSVVHPGETRIAKLERSVIEASKQCGRNSLMHVGPLTTWSAFLRDQELPARRLLAHPNGATLASKSGDVAVAVGPEGGFTDAEVAEAVAAGWQIVGLGPRLLRIETAAITLAVLCGAGQIANY